MKKRKYISILLLHSYGIYNQASGMIHNQEIAQDAITESTLNEILNDANIFLDKVITQRNEYTVITNRNTKYYKKDIFKLIENQCEMLLEKHENGIYHLFNTHVLEKITILKSLANNTKNDKEIEKVTDFLEKIIALRCFVIILITRPIFTNLTFQKILNQNFWRDVLNQTYINKIEKVTELVRIFNNRITINIDMLKENWFFFLLPALFEKNYQNIAAYRTMRNKRNTLFKVIERVSNCDKEGGENTIKVLRQLAMNNFFVRLNDVGSIQISIHFIRLLKDLYKQFKSKNRHFEFTIDLYSDGYICTTLNEQEKNMPMHKLDNLITEHEKNIEELLGKKRVRYQVELQRNQETKTQHLMEKIDEIKKQHLQQHNSHV